MHTELVLIACAILAVFIVPSLITVRTGQIAAAGAGPDQIAPHRGRATALVESDGAPLRLQ